MRIDDCLRRRALRARFGGLQRMITETCIEMLTLVTIETPGPFFIPEMRGR